MNCSDLLAAVTAAQCGKNATVGLEDNLILVNFNDVDKAASVVTSDVISDLVLKSGKKGYTFTTIGRSFNDAGVPSVNRGTYKNTVSHSIPLRIFIKTEPAKAFVNKLIAGARFMAIAKNNEIGTAGEVKYEVYGWDNGLEITNLASTVAMADGVVYDVTVSSIDGAGEGSLPKSIWDTDLETTELIIAGLTT
ncbi:MAG: hypothetical protein BGO29_14790 [Bacteroidales bacterium 36-12]|nr:MAG: hypothetical protein BGO29_14790 [Bacteroidales bacterium 36-12]